MDSTKEARLKACLAELSELLYEETAPEEIATLEGIESSVASALARNGWAKTGNFFIEKTTGTTRGRERKLKSCVGLLKLRESQAKRLGVEPYQRLSPVLEKCCLRLSATASFGRGEKDIRC